MPRCFYRRIVKQHYDPENQSIDPLAFQPRPKEIRNGTGPSILDSTLIGPYEALGNWCEKNGGHLTFFPEEAFPDGFGAEQRGKNPRHYEIVGPIYPNDDPRIDWAAHIASRARMKLLCVKNEPHDLCPAEPDPPIR